MSASSARLVPSPSAFRVDPMGSFGLNLRVFGGFLLGGFAWQAVPTVTLALADNAFNYVEVSPYGVIQSNTSGFSAGAAYLFVVTTASGVVTNIEQGDLTGRTLSVQAPAKVGTTAGWVVGAANNQSKMATLPASQTSSTLVVPVDGLEVGEIITAFYIEGSIQSAGNTGTITADLRKLTGAAAGAVDSSVGAMAAPLSVTANTLFGAANAGKVGLNEPVVAGVSYYLLITATTGVSVTEELQAVKVLTIS